MSDKTTIGYADATWNIVTGCTKVSPGCKYCFAEREFERLRKNEATVYFNRQFNSVRFHKDPLTMPFSWRSPKIVFVATMGDLFHDEITDEELWHIFAVMSVANHHKYLIFTKRVKRAMMFSRDPRVYDRIREARSFLGKKNLPLFPEDYDYPLPNVGLIASAENDDEYVKRSFFLEKSRFAFRGFSFEPLLGEINLDTRTDFKPDWIAIGGETGGPKQEVRKTEKAWILSLISQANIAGIPVWFKSWGEYGEAGQKIGRKASGNEIDGKYYEAFPFDRTEAPAL